MIKIFYAARSLKKRRSPLKSPAMTFELMNDLGKIYFSKSTIRKALLPLIKQDLHVVQILLIKKNKICPNC